MVLSACTSDVVENASEVSLPFVYTMEVDGGKADYDAPTRAAKTWNNGDKLYLRLGTSNKGTATYGGGKWTLAMEKEISGSGTCQAVEIDGNTSVSGNTVSMSALNAVYQCTSGSYSRTDNVIKVKVRLDPVFGRLRFKGDSGTAFELEGLTTYTSYNISTGQFTETTVPVSTSIQSMGYSPYIYGRFADASNPTLQANGYTKTCQKGVLQTGKSGSMTLPTKSSHQGWTGGQEDHEMVDLGLSVKWATCNIGSTRAEEHGETFFAWGETSPKSTYSRDSYFDTNYTKYCLGGRYKLDLSDDAAHTLWGEGWRVPSKPEMDELLENCTWTWKEGYNGTTVKGYEIRSKVPGYTDRTIFLPVEGYKTHNDYVNTYLSGYYWTSSFFNEDRDYMGSSCAYFLAFDSRSHQCEGGVRYYGYSIRPVYSDKGEPQPMLEVNMTSISFPETNPSMNIKVTSNTAWKVTSSAAWLTTSRKAGTGNMTFAVSVQANNDAAPRTATLTFECEGITRTVSVTQKGKDAIMKENGHEMVDLGLSVKWATCNIGAEMPEQGGDFFAWGECYPKQEYNWFTYQWCYGTGNSLSKYNSNPEYGTVDRKNTLEPADDAASQRWGGKWRMPTSDNLKEILNRENCTWEFTTRKGMAGYTVTSKKNGKSIFLPAAGYAYENNVFSVGKLGIYSASSVSTERYDKAWTLELTPEEADWGTQYRYYGFTIRPVCP